MCVATCGVCIINTNGDGYVAQAIEYSALSNAPTLQGATNIINNVIFVTLAGESSQAQDSEVIEMFDTVDGILNSNNDSLKNYYKTLTNGNLNVTSNLLSTTSGGDTNVFVYNSSLTRAQCMPSSTQNPTGYTSGNRNMREATLIQEALNALALESNNVPSGSQLDQNSDGKIDSLTVVILNEGEYYQSLNEDNSYLYWPHKWACTSVTPSINGKAVYEYILMTSDMLLGANGRVPGSTIAHEMGHQLGFPDLYEVNDGLSNYVGSLDLMSVDRMQYMNSYSRLQAGWIKNSQFVKLTTNGEYTLKPVSFDETAILDDDDNTQPAYPVVGYYIEDPNYAGQLICIEYRSNTTSAFDDEINNSGLMIYRIDTTIYKQEFYFATNKSVNERASMYVFRQNDDEKPTRLLSGIGSESSFGVAVEDPLQLYQTVTSGDYITYQVDKANPPASGAQYYTVNSGIGITDITANSDGTMSFTIYAPSLDVNPEISASDFNDSKLFSELISAINKSPYDTIRAKDFMNLESLDLSNSEITDLTGLDLISLKSLKYLNLSGNNITQGLDLLAGITSLETLVMMNAGLSDIEFVSNTNIKYINFALNDIEDFSPLTNMTSLEKALMIFNKFDAESEANANILAQVGQGSTKYVFGIQNVANATYLGEKSVYYSTIGIDANVTFTIKKGNEDYTSILANGVSVLQSGKYTAELSIPRGVYNAGNTYSKTVTFMVINVSLIEEYVEILQGQTYTPDTKTSLAGLEGNQLSVKIQTKIGQEGELLDGCQVDTSVVGYQYVIFTITSASSVDELVLTKTIYILPNPYIANDNTGIPDVNLYKSLLSLIGKNPEMIGVNESGKLYEQDFYFYDINNSNVDPISVINFKNSAIASLQGLDKLNLSKVTKIVLNNNQIEDITPLTKFTHLEELHIAKNKINNIDGLQSLTSLVKLDLSFNNITSVLPLKVITDPYTLYNSTSKEQKLVNVNVMFNQLDMSSTDNKWILSTIKPATDLYQYVSPDGIFIVLIQKLNDGDIYTQYSKFTYHQTSANEYLDATGGKAYRYIVRSNNVSVKWEDKPKLLTNSGKYTIGVDTIKKLYEISYDSKYDRVCYVYLLSLTDLQPLDGVTPLLFREDDPTKVLSTESIKLPSVQDVEFSTIRGFTLEDSHKNVAVESLANSGGNVFTNGGPAGNYQIKYTITTYNVNTHEISDVTVDYRSIKIVGNARIKLNTSYADPNGAPGVIDETLFNKIAEISGAQIKKDYDNYNNEYSYLNQYDTYNLTVLDLSSLGIQYVNGLKDFALPKLTVLRLKDNNIKNIAYLKNTFDNLQVLDLSYNDIENASVVKDINSKTQGTFYINLMINKLDITSESNRLLIDASTYQTVNTATKDVLVGLQGLDNEQEIVTFGDDFTKAGFYYFGDNLKNATLNTKAEHVELNEDHSNILDTLYYYFTEAGLHDVRFSCYLNVSNIVAASVDFSATIRHAKVYLSESSANAEYSATDSEEERLVYVNETNLVFEGMDASEFDVSVSVPGFTLSRLDQFTQVIIVRLLADSEVYRTFNKKIIVVDSVAPVISFEGEPIIIKQKGQPTGLNSRYGLDVDVFVTDNYDTDVQVDISIVDQNGLAHSKVDVYYPATYTITFMAIDMSGNTAEPITRTIIVNHQPYSSIELHQPEAKMSVGTIEFSATIIMADGEENFVNLDPVFYWFVDNEYVGCSKPEASQNQYFINSVFEYEALKAGEHTVTLRVNNMSGSIYGEANVCLEKTYYVLFDNQVRDSLIITGVVVVAFVIVTLVVIFAVKRIRAKKYQEFDNKIYKD